MADKPAGVVGEVLSDFGTYGKIAPSFLSGCDLPFATRRGTCVPSGHVVAVVVLPQCLEHVELQDGELSRTWPSGSQAENLPSWNGPWYLHAQSVGEAPTHNPASRQRK